MFFIASSQERCLTEIREQEKYKKKFQNIRLVHMDIRLGQIVTKIGNWEKNSLW